MSIKRDEELESIFGDIQHKPKPSGNPSFFDWLSAKFTRMGPHEGLYTLLECAVLIDRVADRSEMIELRALADRSRELSAHSRRRHGEHIALRKRVRRRMDKSLATGLIWTDVETACKAIRAGWRNSAYAHVVDLILADRVVVAEERKLVKTVAEAFGMNEKLAVDIFVQLRIKNEHVEGWEPGPVGSIPKPATISPSEREWETMGVLSAHEAHYALLLGAIMADESVLISEGAELDALRRSKHMAILTDDNFRYTGDKIRRMSKALGWKTLLEKACQQLPEKLRLPVYGQAVDLVMADLNVLKAETTFLEKIKGLLAISEGDALEMFRILRIKNDH
jgi:uncharacterized tellurite resistance protein B-like protein